MTFGETVKNELAHPLRLAGRTSRSGYWYWVLFVALVFFAATFTIGFAAAAVGIYQEFVMLLYLAAVASAFCIGVRRLHDVGKSGWLMLLGLIPFAGLYLLYLYCQRGEQSENQYGPPSL